MHLLNYLFQFYWFYLIFFSALKTWLVVFVIISGYNEEIWNVISWTDLRQNQIRSFILEIKSNLVHMFITMHSVSWVNACPTVSLHCCWKLLMWIISPYIWRAVNRAMNEENWPLLWVIGNQSLISAERKGLLLFLFFSRKACPSRRAKQLALQLLVVENGREGEAFSFWGSCCVPLARGHMQNAVSWAVVAQHDNVLCDYLSPGEIIPEAILQHLLTFHVPLTIA